MNKLAVAAGAVTVALAALTGLAWSRESGGASTGSVPVVDGAQLFHAKGCATCHDGPGSRAGFEVGPDLGQLPAVAASREPGLDAETYVRRSITSPQSFIVPGFGHEMQSMPALAVTPAEIDALVAYLLRSG
jgi:mono/diheme cytochrome c family protein